jgi:hypothetical protein
VIRRTRIKSSDLQQNRCLEAGHTQRFCFRCGTLSMFEDGICFFSVAQSAVYATVVKNELPPHSIVRTIDISRHPVIRFDIFNASLDFRVVYTVWTIVVLSCTHGKDGNEAYFIQCTLTACFPVAPIELFDQLPNQFHCRTYSFMLCRVAVSFFPE